MERTYFETKSALRLPGCSVEELVGVWAQLGESFRLEPAQLVEACSYSMAMVARFALGQSASDGKVLVFASDSPAGWVALGAFRHLVNAGADGVVVVDRELSEIERLPELARQIGILERLEVPIVDLAGLLADGAEKMLAHCHMALYGLFSRERYAQAPASFATLHEVLNEAATPVHCVECPGGLNPDTGSAQTDVLYASSTLSLGLPLLGLHAGREFAGRHYVCDTSCPRSLVAEVIGAEAAEVYPRIFGEQPVVQMSPA